MDSRLAEATKILDADAHESQTDAAEARKYDRLQRLRKADLLLGEVVDESPADEAYVRWAEVASRMRDWDVAIVRWQTVLRKVSKKRDLAHYSLAVAYRNTHSYHRARFALDRVKTRAMRQRVVREYALIEGAETAAAAGVTGNMALAALIDSSTKTTVSGLVDVAILLASESERASRCIRYVTEQLQRADSAKRGRRWPWTVGVSQQAGIPHSEHVRAVFFCGFGWSGSGALHDYFRQSCEAVDPFGRAETPIFESSAGARHVMDTVAADPKSARSTLLTFLYHLVLGVGGHATVEPKRRRATAIMRSFEDADRFSEAVARASVELYRNGTAAAEPADPAGMEQAMRNFFDQLVGVKLQDGQVALFNNFVYAKHISLARLVSNSRAVAVLRDPRDQYVARVYESRHGNSLSCSWFIKDMRLKYEVYRQESERLGSRVEEVQFEEFVQSPKEQRRLADKLCLTLPPEGGYNPQESLKNIGIYRSYPNVSEIARIEEELSEFLYDPS